MFKVLLDTSVFGFALESSSNEKVTGTKNFLKLISRSQKISVFLSNITITELESSPGEKLRKDLFNLRKEFPHQIVLQKARMDISVYQSHRVNVC